MLTYIFGGISGTVLFIAFIGWAAVNIYEAIKARRTSASSSREPSPPETP